MPKGGYKIIDMQNIPVSGTNTVVPGAYESIESANGKPLLFANCVAETEMNSFFSIAAKSGTRYMVPYYFAVGGVIRYFTFNDNGTVVRNAYTPSGQAADPGEDGPSASM